MPKRALLLCCLTLLLTAGRPMAVGPPPAGAEKLEGAWVVTSATRDGAAMRVKFAHGAGLTSRAPAVSGFEIAGADKIFRTATAKIDGESVVVSASEVREPVAVRYAWTNAPPASLYNSAGLPAAPFRTDNW